MTAASWSGESVSVGVNVGLACGARKADGLSEKALERALGGGIDIPGINRGSIVLHRTRTSHRGAEGRTSQTNRCCISVGAQIRPCSGLSR